MNKDKALDSGLTWIKQQLQSSTPVRAELHNLVREAAAQFNVEVDLMCRRAESSIVHTIEL